MTATALASEDTRPSMGENHPAALAFHAINNGAQIILLVRNRIDFDIEATYTRAAIGTDLVRASELLTEATEELARMQELLERQERTIEEQRVENVGLSHLRDYFSEKAMELLAGNNLLVEQLRAKVKDEIEAQREITDLRRRNAQVVQRLEQLGAVSAEAVEAAARFHNQTQTLYRDTVGVIRPLGATPLTEAPLLTAGGGV